ncbi:3-deoxy-D-manno-octulosonate cytidylyltransferase [Helicobacter sp. 13S00401-1]|uniref:3-deoxy-manno-octulosonate cytidylyltransferase n=1 Tax=Helicobacter sp. 13S00401-1 TaxID=1905758 RepID=UPI000BA590E1|nr:3-deoxy-manno-octulosonate cytidylyltransferase [Helicobacter sp. 13S00401-1]PAF50051.1 3-deoxy-D-manno-octulosonate cytidylyltransferase [Helicobacter sp. 13S00401-1]
MIIIPARLRSTRFPNKILSDIYGLPMCIRVAKNASKVDDTILAVDDFSVYELALKHDVRAVMTDPKHPNGTLRVLEACILLDLPKSEVIINLQADEPFLEVENIKKLLDLTKTSSFMATLAKTVSLEEALSPNLVKVVLNDKKCALYFSRSLIPFNRDKDVAVNYLGHLGMYGFLNIEVLKEYASFKECALENIEKLEQLRVLYHGREIALDIVESKSFGIDTKEDLEEALKVFKKDNLYE